MRSAIGRELGRTIEYHLALGSTQDRALELSASGVDRAVVVAEEQREGRGTRGRTWSAPAGSGLLASWLVRPAPAAPALTGLLASVAVARALESLGAPRVTVKWPNDVLLDGRKVAGVLAHGRTGATGDILVIGIGVNVAQTVDDFPVEIRSRATSLALAGAAVDRLPLLVRLTAELDTIAMPASHGRALREWRTRAPLLGRVVEVLREGEPVLVGIARELADDGALIVETDYGAQRVVAGEVTVR